MAKDKPAGGGRRGGYTPWGEKQYKDWLDNADPNYKPPKKKPPKKKPKRKK